MISILFASTTAGGCVVKTCRINLRAPLICPPLEVSRSARGGQIKGALKLIRHVFTTHPPAVVDANKIEIIQQVLSLKTMKSPSKELRKVLMPIKFLYHPDKNIGLRDIKWRIMCEHISILLNDFETPQTTDHCKQIFLTHMHILNHHY